MSVLVYNLRGKVQEKLFQKLKTGESTLILSPDIFRCTGFVCLILLCNS